MAKSTRAATRRLEAAVFLGIRRHFAVHAGSSLIEAHQRNLHIHFAGDRKDDSVTRLQHGILSLFQGNFSFP
jgi:hypothetical protein